jgi:hypothetical protein
MSVLFRQHTFTRTIIRNTQTRWTDRSNSRRRLPSRE